MFSKSKIVFTAFVAGAVLLGASAAKADIIPSYPVFQINEGVVPGSQPNTVKANSIAGSYTELLQVNLASPDANTGTFNVSLGWNATSIAYVTNLSNSTVLSQLGTQAFGATYQYGLYALYKGSGTVTFNPDGSTSFSFAPSANDGLQLWLDPNADTQVSMPASATDYFNVTDGTAGTSLQDILLANGAPKTGAGTFVCNPNNDCGSFGATSLLELTSFGSTYFTSPNPFYSMTIESGLFNQPYDFRNSPIVITGLMNAIFVPEPSAVALLGLGMLGLAVSRRKLKKDVQA